MTSTPCPTRAASLRCARYHSPPTLLELLSCDAPRQNHSPKPILLPLPRIRTVRISATDCIQIMLYDHKIKFVYYIQNNFNFKLSYSLQSGYSAPNTVERVVIADQVRSPKAVKTVTAGNGNWNNQLFDYHVIQNVFFRGCKPGVFLRFCVGNYHNQKTLCQNQWRMGHQNDLRQLSLDKVRSRYWRVVWQFHFWKYITLSKMSNI